MTDPLLKIENLRIELKLRSGPIPVIDDLSLELNAGETLSFVGESGCGKSMTALAIMGLLPEKVGSIGGGRILFQGNDMARMNPAELRAIRGNEISMIFQEPMTSLNPVYTVGEQIAEVLRRHKGMGQADAWKRATELMDAVRIPNAKARVGDYPHQMSGGQRQRVMIAIALACAPKILIADEPTTALDVTVQAQIFDLLRDLGRDTGTATILITHDMGAVAEMADRMVVMYAGRKAEEGPVEPVISHPRHPYTKGLISCVPHLLAELTEERPDLTEVPGIVPSLGSFGADACLFASRCYMADAQCRNARPPEVAFGPQTSACWKADIV
ncbi:ABC transporter ATP-binding protein [Litoreibacter arenae]|uniref:Oligopeptide transport ATP-binding protein OppD n=1 Tax=Litoreibacter arenae DSM 19593 TaxID=1123360 RepID=S9QIH9_9RHOB|nr:ABC transporter ATP-binding protein [Litoreibacter arenae]EPX79393.1 Oligopeptide transport ATP-binding protein OppD [Litoreibacter arenae DSM 19593]